eukprot:481244_1
MSQTQTMESQGQERQYHPRLNLQGETCCCFIEIRAGVIMICLISIIAAVSQYFYEATDESNNKIVWWLWIYVGLCSGAAIIGILSACLYKPLLAKIYCVWMIISCVIWIVDGILFSDDTLGYGLTFSILCVKFYFIYILWKFAKIITTPYGRLNSV